ncbi:pinin [Uranotaenia lowii]|uniref:pinin n=1 Tax=Uranotaenia lowii TaxID=190385 RepID=UPI002478C889|nr:pinin [Uranotaenia lowii]
MATEVMKGYSHLQQELDKARDNLKGLNDNIKKIIGRDPSNTDQYSGGSGNTFGVYSRNEVRKRNSSGAFDQGQIGRRLDQQDRRFSDGGGINPAKRRAVGETKSVFSRLSGPPNRDVEFDKPRIHSRVIKEQPTRQEIVAAQGNDERSRARNRRIFGSLLGTLQKFSQEESKLKSKEDKKAQIEKKLEEQQKIERENLRREKQSLFTDRKRQQLEIRTIETKLSKMKDLEVWEESKKPLVNFIKTKTSPCIYYLPKRMDSKMEKRLQESQEEHAKMIEQKRTEVMESIAAVEARFNEDIKTLEENAANRNKSNDGSVNINSTGSKLDRIAAADDDDDYNEEDHHHNSPPYQYDTIEGPALPSALTTSSNFKITIHNSDVKQEKETSPKIVRLIESTVTSSMNSNCGSTQASDSGASFLTQGENLQITFKTDRTLE